ncbi:LOW QUALITY PROTEIN: hypothetical protein HID58_069804 [Brassica napus]|uniref:Uncharacterized protein n=1 Tax=Brassica napus TaxID=3708 RepID=A0ABQ7YWW7_BRANA|nr:LOW QUALITY PROTEIN: hypothetical protein HID58_069804 [Brassica napus]
MNKAFMYQKLVAFLGFLVYKFYGEELPETFCGTSLWIKGSMSGITMFLPNKNSQRSAYSVKDRDCKNVPELGHSHVMELRMMLGLY